jgi:branched-chain amino acid transport system ATP-binding protein
MPPERTPILALESLAVHYGKVQAVQGVSLKVGEGEVVAILGANGAGKSSIAKAIVGLVPPAAGEIRFKGDSIARRRSEERAALGIGYVPEGRRVFADLTVHENLQMGGYLVPRQVPAGLEEVYALFPRLAERRRQLAATLSGGEQQMLAIGRALMRRPALLVLDEPSLGLSPILVQVIFRTIDDIRKRGITIVLAEQSANIALSLADRAYLLETGRVILEGDAAALKQDARVGEAYLGLPAGAGAASA